MWLTRIISNTNDRDARRDLTDTARLHRRVMMLVPEGLGPEARHAAGVLFRVEDARAGTQILVQTAVEPQPSRLPAAYGQTAVRPLDPLLNALDKGMVLRYRIAANTSKRLGRTSEHAGKVVALRGAAAEQWWTDRAERHGLAIRTISAVRASDAIGRQEGPSVRHAVTRFDGLAVVTDPDAVRAAVRAGIGRGKSYGCGLLSLAAVSAATR